MKLISISILVFCGLLVSFTNDKGKDVKCNTWEKHQLYKGEKGGCYYIKIKDKKRVKVYVDKDKCNC
jgi:hypothetical protein